MVTRLCRSVATMQLRSPVAMNISYGRAFQATEYGRGVMHKEQLIDFFVSAILLE